MELVAVYLAVPVAFIAAGIYTCVIRSFLRYRPISRIALFVSIAVLVGLLLEWSALAMIGAVRSRAIIGPSFYPVHLVLFFLAIPALANIVIIKMGDTVVGSWFAVALMCSALALPVVLTQYVVVESLYGVDGGGGPYGQAP